MSTEPDATDPASEEAPAEKRAERAIAEIQEGEIAGLKAEVADLKDRLLRSIAEADNIRKRAERERAETSRYAIAAFARDLVVVADNLARALQAIPAEARDTEAVRTLVTGVELTQRELQSALERHGVRKIEPKGEAFNAHFHQAVAEVAAPGATPGNIVEVVQPGYAIDERLIRAAMVVVAKGQKPEASGPGAQVDTSV